MRRHESETSNVKRHYCLLLNQSPIHFEARQEERMVSGGRSAMLFAFFTLLWLGHLLGACCPCPQVVSHARSFRLYYAHVPAFALHSLFDAPGCSGVGNRWERVIRAMSAQGIPFFPVQTPLEDPVAHGGPSMARSVAKRVFTGINPPKLSKVCRCVLQKHEIQCESARGL